MACLTPILVREPTLNKVVPVPCGKCPSCLMAKREMLAARIDIDISSPRCFWKAFITLTYSDENLEYNVIDKGVIYDKMPSVSRETIQKFLKRYRKNLGYDTERTILRYYCSAEYGDITKRPHYHLIMYALGEDTFKMSPLEALYKSWQYCDYSNLNIHDIYETDFSEGAIKYVAKHQIKRCLATLEQADGFRLMSKGIGMELFHNCYALLREQLCNDIHKMIFRGHTTPLPRYYREKLGLGKTGNSDLHYSKKMLEYLYERSQKAFIKQLQEIKRIQYEKNVDENTALRIWSKKHNKSLQYSIEYFDKMYKKLSQSNKI